MKCSLFHVRVEKKDLLLLTMEQMATDLNFVLKPASVTRYFQLYVLIPPNYI
jgi:hypothetical protein